MAESKWMVHCAGNWAGPFGEARLREYVAEGIMEGSVLVKNEAGQVMPILDAFGPQTTPQFVPAPQPPPNTSYDTVPSCKENSPKKEIDGKFVLLFIIVILLFSLIMILAGQAMMNGTF